jgi:glycosyltransferase involved in cell wall biosynthesis
MSARDWHGPVKSIALIDPMSDRGLGAYTHELAEGLTAAGISTTVFATGHSQTVSLPRRHRHLPVLGSVLARQRALLNGGGLAGGAPTPGRPTSTLAGARLPARKRLNAGWYHALRGTALRWELAWHLKRRGYDVIWTQWPYMDAYGVEFWAVCRRLGLRLVHTVHDVTPHEPKASYDQVTRIVYQHSDLLVVHSEHALAQLIERFPAAAAKAIVAPHGLYTTYPRRPEGRTSVRRELQIGDAEALVLCFGAVRPFKNYEAVVHAFAERRFPGAVLVIAGTEQGYSGQDPTDTLAATRRLVGELGLTSMVRLLAGPFDTVRTAEILEAADVTMLPYVSGSGSGLLLLCMTFGKYVVATPTGGMSEHLQDYPPHTVLAGARPAEVGEGLTTALERIRSPSPPLPTRPDYLEWPRIAERVLRVLETGELASARCFPAPADLSASRP